MLDELFDLFIEKQSMVICVNSLLVSQVPHAVSLAILFINASLSKEASWIKPFHGILRYLHSVITTFWARTQLPTLL